MRTAIVAMNVQRTKRPYRAFRSTRLASHFCRGRKSLLARDQERHIALISPIRRGHQQACQSHRPAAVWAIQKPKYSVG
jgi:hypothetical protein